MRLPSREEAIKMLMESGCTPGVILHSLTVSQLAVEIADKLSRRGVKVNRQLVEVGAILHDIGRSKTSTVHHGVIGAKMLRDRGLPEPVALIAERHVGCGIPREEAKRLGWPDKNYSPETIEEKIVAYADKLVKGGKKLTIKTAIRNMERELGADHPAIKRMLNLHEEISGLLRKNP